MKKWLLISLASAVLAGLALSQGTEDESTPGRPTRTAGSVVLVILDTVRADHLSACGYARPTSPFAEELFSNADFATCQAYSPASWTLPSHASFFTGLPAEEHGANTVSRGDVMLPWGTRFTPLS